MSDPTAIILAAGLSRRMGAQNKLLLQINGIPMIRHMVQTYSAVTTRPVVVVTGHQASQIEAALAETGAMTVLNPDYAQGQQSSVVCGLQAVGQDTDLLIGLGDQPLLTSDDLRALLEAHHAADPARISIPAMDEQRGNPIVVPAALRTQLLADRKSPGCKTYTRAYPEQVQFLRLASPGFYADVDIPEAYRLLEPQQQEHAQ